MVGIQSIEPFSEVAKLAINVRNISGLIKMAGGQNPGGRTRAGLSMKYVVIIDSFSLSSLNSLSLLWRPFASDRFGPGPGIRVSDSGSASEAGSSGHRYEN